MQKPQYNMPPEAIWNEARRYAQSGTLAVIVTDDKGEPRIFSNKPEHEVRSLFETAGPVLAGLETAG